MIAIYLTLLTALIVACWIIWKQEKDYKKFVIDSAEKYKTLKDSYDWLGDRYMTVCRESVSLEKRNKYLEQDDGDLRHQLQTWKDIAQVNIDEVDRLKRKYKEYYK